MAFQIGCKAVQIVPQLIVSIFNTVSVTEVVGFAKKTSFLQDMGCRKPNYKVLVPSIVVLKLPDVKRRREERPKQGWYCKGETFQRWGQVNKSVKDVRVRNVKVYRYRCCHCKRTFRDYPEGNTSADQTERLRLFAILLWTLGLSPRASRLILSGLNVLVSPMTIWRDVQGEAQKLKRHNHWKPVRVWVWMEPVFWAGEKSNPCWWRKNWASWIEPRACGARPIPYAMSAVYHSTRAFTATIRRDASPP